VKKIVILDAADALHGSVALGDFFSLPIHLRGCRVTLVDDDAEALDRMVRYAICVDRSLGELFEIEASTDRRAALRGADFVVQLPLSESRESLELDWRVPLRHGVRHIAGRNGGPGALSRAMRIVPRLLVRARDVEDVAPRALFLNQAEPLARTSVALARCTTLRFVGVPAQRQAGYRWLSRAFGWSSPGGGEPDERSGRNAVRRLRARAAGLHGLSFFMTLQDWRSGADMYPLLRARLAVALPDFELMSRRLLDVFGLYCASGDAVAGEYFGFAAETMSLHGPDFDAEARWRDEAAALVHGVAVGELQPAYRFVRASKSRVFALIAALVNDIEQDEPALLLPNDGRIVNLPVRAVVETPAHVVAGVLHGEHIGALPDGLASLLQREEVIHELAVQAAVTGDRASALQALLLDSHVHSYAQATHLLDDICSMTF